MKKFLAIVAIASLAVACKGKGEKKEGETKDTTAVVAPVTPDTTAPAPAPADTTAPAPAKDTTSK